MKIDVQSIYVGMGIVGLIAGVLSTLRRRLLLSFAVCLAVFLLFELLCLIAGPECLVPVWWAVHFPSAIALGDESVERYGAIVSAAFHVGDFFLWSTLITAALWFINRKSKVPGTVFRKNAHD
ncbi:MAG: hypothetical protein IH624_15320 [Phycisphaerae bacterium]|nr:hypothetical protein [Phycisphaerae bacterium]